MKTKGRFEPLEIQISRQTDVIERHERQIARHTAIQSWTNIVTLFIGVVTTGALIWIAWQQNKQSQRQVDLEYAKVAPQFNVNVDYIESQDYFALGQRFPRHLSISLERGEAELTSVRVWQDVEVVIVPKNRSLDHLNCVFRIGNMFATKAGDLEHVVNQKFSQIAQDPVELISNSSDTMILEPGNTWINITFDDLFGEERDLLYEVKYGRAERSASQEKNGYYSSEIVETDLQRDIYLSRERLVMPPENPPRTDECKQILQLYQQS